MKSSRISNEEDFSPRKFVEQLLSEGNKCYLGQTKSDEDISTELPYFYDQRLYNKGRMFFFNNAFALFSNKFLGLLGVISIPSIRQLLISTKMSDSGMKSYRRYFATLLHVKIWYDEDFSPGSRLWKSMKEVRKMHNSASRIGCKIGLGRISQRDMALTQLGFLGFALARGQYLGIICSNEEELKGFIHIWRVIGSVMGIEDRFNICRESVEETRQICEILLEEVYHEEISKKEKEYLELAYYFVEGMHAITPLTNFKSTMCVIHKFSGKDHSLDTPPTYFELDNAGMAHYKWLMSFREKLQSYWWRLFLNKILLWWLALTEFFPLIGIYYYGFKNAVVNIGI